MKRKYNISLSTSWSELVTIDGFGWIDIIIFIEKNHIVKQKYTKEDQVWLKIPPVAPCVFAYCDAHHSSET